jgi:hypothetical protein
MVREAVLRDMKDNDPDLCMAAMTSISSLPLNVLRPATATVAHFLASLVTAADSATEVCAQLSVISMH